MSKRIFRIHLNDVAKGEKPYEVCVTFEKEDRAKGHDGFSRYFSTLREACMFIKQLVRQHGLPKRFERYLNEEKLTIDFLPPKTPVEKKFEGRGLYARPDKLLYARHDKQGMSVAAFWLINTPQQTFECHRYWIFGTDEIEKAVERWSRMERTYGTFEETNFFGFWAYHKACGG
jgi:hypothetical protein